MDFFWKNKIWKNNKSKNESSSNSYVIEHAESNGHICKVVGNIFYQVQLEPLFSLCVQSGKNRKNKGGPSIKRTKEKSRAKSQ